MVDWKEYTDLRINEMEKRVSLALAALERADQHSRSTVAIWLSIGAILLSLVAIEWHK